MQASDLSKCRKDEQGRAMVQVEDHGECSVLAVHGGEAWVLTRAEGPLTYELSDLSPLPPAPVKGETPALKLRHWTFRLDRGAIKIEPNDGHGITSGTRLSLECEEHAPLRDWLNTHFPASPPPQAAPADPDAADKAACAAPDVEAIRCAGKELANQFRKPVCGEWFCDQASGLPTHYQPQYAHNIEIFGAHGKRHILRERIPAPTPSIPAPSQPEAVADVEGIVRKITKAADEIADKLWGDRPPAGIVRDCFIQALREHLPALATGDAQRLMRLVEKGWQIWKCDDIYKLSRVQLPDIFEFATLTAAIDAAEKHEKGGASNGEDNR